MARFFHPLLTLIASREFCSHPSGTGHTSPIPDLWRKRSGGEIHTRPEERQRLFQLGNSLGRAIEELTTIMSPSTFHRSIREEQPGTKQKNPNGGQTKPREIIIEMAKTTGVGLIEQRLVLWAKNLYRRTISYAVRSRPGAALATASGGALQ